MDAISTQYIEPVFHASAAYAAAGTNGDAAGGQAGPYRGATAGYFGQVTPLRTAKLQPLAGPAIPRGGSVGEHVDVLA